MNRMFFIHFLKIFLYFTNTKFSRIFLDFIDSLNQWKLFGISGGDAVHLQIGQTDSVHVPEARPVSDC